MQIRRSRFMSLVGSSLLLTLVALLPEYVSAQGLAYQPDWINRDGSTPTGFPRFISIDYPIFANARSDAITHPQQKPPIRQQPASGLPVDGTWQDNGGIVVIKLDGRELRLRKTAASGEPTRIRDESVLRANHVVAESSSSQADAGSAVGRLMNRGRPLVHCKVSLIPLRRSLGGYTVDRRGEPQRTQTDDGGHYRFENVPPGPYKLFWLPAGQTRWIRRLEYKPDVRVRRNETSQIKVIGVALRTLN